MSLSEELLEASSLNTCDTDFFSIHIDEDDPIYEDSFLNQLEGFTFTNMVVSPSSSSNGVESRLNENVLVENDSYLSRDATSKTKQVVRKEIETKVWKCEVCSKEFSQNFKLIRHLKIHGDNRNYTCAICGKAFRQMCSLYQHRVTHSMAKPHSCPVCNKSFNRLSALSLHRKIHDDEKSHQCPHCPKAFHQKVNLRNHIFTHTKERPYKCDICAEGFNQVANLTRHKLRMHGHNSVQHHECHTCGKSFMKRANCHKHELHEHADRMQNPSISTTDMSQSTTDMSQSTTDQSKLTTDKSKSTTDMSKSTTDMSQSTTDKSKLTTDKSKSTTDMSKSTTDKSKSTTDKSMSDGDGDYMPNLPPDTIIFPIDPINTEALRVARDLNQPLLVLLKPLDGSPVVVRLIEAGTKQMLVPIVWTDLCRYSQIITTNEFERDQTNPNETEKFKLRINIPIVATMHERPTDEDLSY